MSPSNQERLATVTFLVFAVIMMGLSLYGCADFLADFFAQLGRVEHGL